MGPRSRDRGITGAASYTWGTGGLQWGRDHVIAELIRVGFLGRFVERFNGAAIT